MKSHSTKHARKREFMRGVRLSRIDVGVLVIGAITAYAIGAHSSLFVGVGVGFVVIHFFLFCNVFRVSRPLELSWSAIFVLLATLNVFFGFPGWQSVFGLTTLATIGVVVVELRKPSYHGFGWERFNPKLPEWWKSQEEIS